MKTRDQAEANPVPKRESRKPGCLPLDFKMPGLMPSSQHASHFSASKVWLSYTPVLINVFFFKENTFHWSYRSL